jgi:hypothetical protein
MTVSTVGAAARQRSLPPSISLEEAVRRVRTDRQPRDRGYVQGALAVDFAAAVVAPVRGPRSITHDDLPDPAQWAARITCALLEVMTGTRPPPQVLRWTTPEVYAVVARRGALAARRHARDRQPRSRRRIVVRRVLVCQPADAVAEVAVVAMIGTRVRAVAIRLTGQDGRWKVSALQVG